MLAVMLQGAYTAGSACSRCLHHAQHYIRRYSSTNHYDCWESFWSHQGQGHCVQGQCHQNYMTLTWPSLYSSCHDLVYTPLLHIPLLCLSVLSKLHAWFSTCSNQKDVIFILMIYCPQHYSWLYVEIYIYWLMFTILINYKWWIISLALEGYLQCCGYTIEDIDLFTFVYNTFFPCQLCSIMYICIYTGCCLICWDDWQ